jgi:hypothetical protein
MYEKQCNVLSNDCETCEIARPSFCTTLTATRLVIGQVTTQVLYLHEFTFASFFAVFFDKTVVIRGFDWAFCILLSFSDVLCTKASFFAVLSNFCVGF